MGTTEYGTMTRFVAAILDCRERAGFEVLERVGLEGFVAFRNEDMLHRISLESLRLQTMDEDSPAMARLGLSPATIRLFVHYPVGLDFILGLVSDLGRVKAGLDQVMEGFPLPDPVDAKRVRVYQRGTRGYANSAIGP